MIGPIYSATLISKRRLSGVDLMAREILHWFIKLLNLLLLFINLSKDLMKWDVA